MPEVAAPFWCEFNRAFLHTQEANRRKFPPRDPAMKTSDKRTTAELLIATIEAAIARGCRHYSERGELLATTLEVLECLQREGFVTVEEPGMLADERVRP